MTDTSQLLDLESVQRVAATLSARDTWSRAALLDIQQQRLNSLLQHAVADSPYYRDAIGSAVAAGTRKGEAGLFRLTLTLSARRITKDITSESKRP